MRNRFEQQVTMGVVPIPDVQFTIRSRDELPALLQALQQLYVRPEYNQQVCSILSDKISKGKKQTGRKGMSLWETFVLGQVRLCLNIDYDRLHDLANHHTQIRGILGVLPSDFSQGMIYEYQNIYDNVGLLDEDLLRRINDVIVQMGQDVFKKKEAEALRIKADTFVVESNIHFPTDYNLLWDSGRKCLDCLEHIQENNPSLSGWRKCKDWSRSLKSMMRVVGKASSGGGKNKEQRVRAATRQYLKKAKALSKKIHQCKQGLACTDITDLCNILALDYFLEMLDKHIDLVDRRLLKGEKIPQPEKIYSIFETYTDWISKGKLHPNVELGKKLLIATDQYNLIVDYQITENKADSCYTLQLAQRIMNRYPVQSLSFDKGFWSPLAFELLDEVIPELVMPKKGKPNQQEKIMQQQRKYKKTRHQHSAVESNINELEQRGLDKCPDKGWDHFKRYIGLSVCAYNLHKIGKEIIRLEEEQKKKQQKKLKKAA